jgi:hypothetical protein
VNPLTELGLKTCATELVQYEVKALELVQYEDKALGKAKGHTVSGDLRLFLELLGKVAPKWNLPASALGCVERQTCAHPEAVAAAVHNRERHREIHGSMSTLPSQSEQSIDYAACRSGRRVKRFDTAATATRARANCVRGLRTLAALSAPDPRRECAEKHGL